MSFVFQANQNAVQNETDAVNGFIKQHIAYPPDLVKAVCLYFYHQLLHPFAIIDNYDSMGLNVDLLRGVYSYGLERPSPIEQRLIVPIIEGNDVLIQMTPRAPRRAVYTIPAIQIIDPGIPQCQTLVLALSREDAQITYKMFRSLATYLSITSMTLVGGSSVREDIRQTREGRQIIIGTPGKVNCMIQKGALKLNALKLFVVDNIDEMLDRGFREQLFGIMQELPMERTFHVALLTANINGDILSFSDRFQSNPIRLLKRNYDGNHEIMKACMKSISHYFVAVEKEDLKLPTLYDLLESLDFQRVLIYCNTSERAKWLKHKLVETDCTVQAIHEETKPQIRKEIAREFHFQALIVLIATDCFHSDHELCVINFDLPIAKEHYCRRIGVKTCLWETSPTHCKQLVINFVTEEQETMYEELAAFYAIAVDELPMELDSM